MARLKNVCQGYAEVYEDCRYIGFVEHGRDRFGEPTWWAYDSDEHRVSEFGAIKRGHAVRQLCHKK